MLTSPVFKIGPMRFDQFAKLSIRHVTSVEIDILARAGMPFN